MKKPNVREASDNYGKYASYSTHTHTSCMYTLYYAGKLANGLKNEENPQYAAMCFSAMAK